MCKVSLVLSPVTCISVMTGTRGRQGCEENGGGIQSMMTLARKQIWKAWAVGPAGREGADEQGMAGCSQELHLYNICVRGYH